MWSLCTNIMHHAFLIKHKDDLLALSGVLGLQVTKTVTVTELVANIKSHLTENPEIQQDPRFSGLFQQGRWWQAEPMSHTE